MALLRPREAIKRAKDANADQEAGIRIVQRGAYGDLLDMGVIDPTKVTRTALQNAASIAGLILTTDATVAEAPKEEKPAAPAMPEMDY